MRGLGRWRWFLPVIFALGLAQPLSPTHLRLTSLVVVDGGGGVVFPANFFGVTPVTFSDGEMARLHRGGIGWTRINLVLGESWSTFGSKLTMAACNGLTVIPLLIGDPSSPPTTTSALGVWEAFVTQAIARYGSNGSFWSSGVACSNGTAVPSTPLTRWQVWNEEDDKDSWGGNAASTTTAHQYGELLIATKHAMAASSDPTARIVMGGLNLGAGNRATTYMGYLYDDFGSTINDDFNEVDVHPYAATPDDSLNAMLNLRSLLDSNGAQWKPMWVTEVAWSSCAQTMSSGSSYCDATSYLVTNENGQNDNLIAVYDDLAGAASTLKLKGVAWFSFQDPPTGSCNGWECGSGLLRRDGSAKPAWTSMAILAGGSP